MKTANVLTWLNMSQVSNKIKDERCQKRSHLFETKTSAGVYIPEKIKLNSFINFWNKIKSLP